MEEQCIVQSRVSLCYRDNVSLFQGNRRETRLLGILSFVHSTVWKVLFGKVRGDFKFELSVVSFYGHMPVSGS